MLLSDYFTFVVPCPGLTMLMLPAYPHISLASEVRHGFPPTITVGLAGIHVPAGTNVQGWGVRTPIAAAVADATAGLASDVHRPNGEIFVL